MKVNDLALAAKFAAQKDTRYYLNGVYCKDRKLIGSDGHRLVRIEVDTDFDGIIPADAVLAFVKAHKGTDIKCHVQIMERSGGIWELMSPIKSQLFTPIDAKYPKFDAVLNSKDDLETDLQNLQYNFQYLADAQKWRADWVRNQLDTKKDRDKVYDSFCFTWLKGRALYKEPGLEIVVMALKP